MAEYQDVIMAGFGGQGVMLIGNLLAQAGMEQGLEVSFIPVYGAEMRGGTAQLHRCAGYAPHRLPPGARAAFDHRAQRAVAA